MQERHERPSHYLVTLPVNVKQEDIVSENSHMITLKIFIRNFEQVLNMIQMEDMFGPLT